MLGVPVIAKLDANGALAIDDSGAWHVTDAEVEVVDTTGAGDAMAGAALATIASGCDAATATAFGVSVARLALSDWGAGGLVNSRSLTRPYAVSEQGEDDHDYRGTNYFAEACLVGQGHRAEPNRKAHRREIENAVFAGCGDSLAAALLAEHYGHHAKSSGDLVWCSRRSAARATLVAISSSGATGATVLAAETAARQGVSTVAITASATHHSQRPAIGASWYLG